ncbi:MAG: methionine biosynthesis protein MetW [Spirochaetes bacterium]|nr:methionine biosynthesis protein MetW [Spirochaetota bacterium]
MSMSDLRYDLKAISEMIKPGSKVLDLGCGDGTLLEHLKITKNIIPYGIEISSEDIEKCIARGVPVFMSDIDKGLEDYKSNSFDYVILSQTLQVTKKPYKVLSEMLRVGKRCIISFPNFGYFSIRFFLLFIGRMPKVKILPFNWYDTPNIHHLTIKDFFIFCRKNKIRVLKKIYINFVIKRCLFIKVFPNLFAQHGIFMISK